MLITRKHIGIALVALLAVVGSTVSVLSLSAQDPRNRDARTVEQFRRSVGSRGKQRGNVLRLPGRRHHGSRGWRGCVAGKYRCR